MGPPGNPGPAGKPGERGQPGKYHAFLKMVTYAKKFLGPTGANGNDGHYCPCPKRATVSRFARAERDKETIVMTVVTND